MPSNESLDKLKRLFSGVQPASQVVTEPPRTRSSEPVRAMPPPAPAPMPAMLDADHKEHIVAQTAETISEKQAAAVAATPRPPVDFSLQTPEWFGKIQILPRIEWSQQVYVESGTQVAEEIRSFRTNMWTLRVERDIKTVAITSCRHNEGKTTLAVTFSRFLAKNRDRRILLVDADMRRPKVKTLTNLKPSLGLDDLIEGRCEMHEAILYSEKDNLYVLPTVRGHSNASEMLEMPRTAELVKALRPVFDYIVFDTPPILSTTDPMILGRRVDGVVLVVKANSTQRESVEHAQRLLEQVKVNVLGAVLTQMKNYLPKYLYRYQYYHDYYHYYYQKPHRPKK